MAYGKWAEFNVKVDPRAYKFVEKSYDTFEEACLQGYGAYAWQAARRMIRPAGKKRMAANAAGTNVAGARKGKPPMSRNGDLRNGIRFDVDHNKGDVVVGAALLKGNRRVTIPQILEEGRAKHGLFYKNESRYTYAGGRYYRDFGGRFRQVGTGRLVDRGVAYMTMRNTVGTTEGTRRRIRITYRIAAHPYMKPAQEKTIQGIEKIIDKAGKDAFT